MTTEPINSQGDSAPRTVSEQVRRLAKAAPDAGAFCWGGGRMSWAQYERFAQSIAGRLVGLGVEPRDRVLVMLPDGGAVHAAYVGCERAGTTAVGVGWRAGRQELEALAAKTGARAAILPRTTRLGDAQDIVQSLGLECWICVEDGGDGAHLTPGPNGTPGSPVGDSELWLINSTSGTTGLPKCVMQTQRRWFYFHEKAAEFGQLTSKDSFMSVVPAPFGFGLWTSHFTPTLLGAECHVQERFDPAEAARRIADHQISVLCAVSSQFVMILDAAKTEDLSSLRVLFTGGERLPYARSREFEERTGCSVLNFYGSNETGLLSGTRLSDPLERRISSAGRCVEEMQVRLYDDDLNRLPKDVGIGRPACRGPAMSPGYLDDDEANSELFTEDGWMLMGDYVEIDEAGWLTVVGRSADFVVRGGKNISAAAVEEQVSSHPAVRQAAVLAIPDRRLGELVGLCATLEPGTSLSLEDLGAHLADLGVTKEWWPEKLAVVDTLPVSSGGKIAKGELRDRIPEIFGVPGA